LLREKRDRLSTEIKYLTLQALRDRNHYFSYTAEGLKEQRYNFKLKHKSFKASMKKIKCT
jgi:hypothetical protein